jgi:predicted dehydrogenase
MAIDCLNANKHIVIEKPMALSSNKAELIINTASKCNKLVFCVMQNRFSPTMVWLKDVVEKKMLGKINMVAVNCFWNRNTDYYLKSNWHGSKLKDGGPLYTQFSHFIDIMYWLFGDIENIQGKFNDFTHKENTDFEDSGVVSFDFINGGMGCLNYSTAVWGTNLESSITIIGSKGSVKVGGQYMNDVEFCNIKDYNMPELKPSNPPNDYGSYKGSAANHHFIIENVVDTLKGNNSATTNALEGLKVVEIIERIYNIRDGKQG